MNNIGFGIFCFGEDYYFKGTVEKLNHILEIGYDCYILTDTPEYFTERYNNPLIHTILYDREFKSYHDKLLLFKYVLKLHDICIILDADLNITDYSWMGSLKTYEFKNGISYINTLANHRARISKVTDFDLYSEDWSEYRLYAESLYPFFYSLEAIWEYFIVANVKGFNSELFFKYYDDLQKKKESFYLGGTRTVNAPGEGVSMSISAKLSKTPIQRDIELYNILHTNVIDVSRRFTLPEFWPEFMK